LKITLMDGSAYSERRLVNLGEDEQQVFAGLLMALGGWLAALGIGRPRLSAAAPFACLLVAAGAWLLPPGSILPGREIIPLPESFGAGDFSRNAAAKRGAGEAVAADSPEAAVYKWMDACSRLDRDTASSLMTRTGASLTDEEWNRIRAFWATRELVHTSVSTTAEPDKATAKLVAIPRPEPQAWQYYGRFRADRTSSKAFELPLTRGSSGWQIGDTSPLVP
jgi:hypothetical protein